MTRQNVVRNAGQLSNMLETVLYLFVLWRGQNGKKKKETSETMEKQTIHYPRMGYSGKVLTGSGKNDKNNIIGSSVSWGVTRRYRGKESLRRTGLPKTKHLPKEARRYSLLKYWWCCVLDPDSFFPSTSPLPVWTPEYPARHKGLVTTNISTCDALPHIQRWTCFRCFYMNIEKEQVVRLYVFLSRLNKFRFSLYKKLFHLLQQLQIILHRWQRGHGDIQNRTQVNTTKNYRKALKIRTLSCKSIDKK